MLGFGARRALGLVGGREGSSSFRWAVGARSYHERVVDHYNNPRNVGSFDKNDPGVGTGLVGAPACGDVMKLQIRVDEQSGKIVDACFKTFGCGSAIASSSLATEWVKGKQMEEALAIKNTEIAKHLSLPPVKLHCSMLAEDAIKQPLKTTRLSGRSWERGQRWHRWIKLLTRRNPYTTPSVRERSSSHIRGR